MSRAITFPTFDAVDVDLWGRTFTVLPLTKRVIAEANDIEVKQLEADSDEDLVKALAELCDVRLRPTGGQRKKASEVILEKWDADELAAAQLIAFMKMVAAHDDPDFEPETADRPT